MRANAAKKKAEQDLKSSSKQQENSQNISGTYQFQSPYSKNARVASTSIKTGEIGKLKDSDVLQEFWSHTESELDEIDFEEAFEFPPKMPRSLNRFGDMHQNFIGGLVSFKNLNDHQQP